MAEDHVSHFRVRPRLRDGDYHIRFYATTLPANERPEDYAFAVAGDLIFREAEWLTLRELLRELPQMEILEDTP